MNLFNEFEFETFTQVAINHTIEKINESDILNADLKDMADKIIDSLTFTVPVLEKHKITSAITMDDTQKYADNNIDLNNNNVFATATYTVPFIGNPEIFKVKPLVYQNIEQQFTLEHNNLKFKLHTDSKDVDISEEWKLNLIKSSSEIINSIENNLFNLAVIFKEFKNEMIGPVITSLKKRCEELAKAKLIANEINIYNNNSKD